MIRIPIFRTIAFEYFIFSDQYIDDSNNIIFENICKLSEDDAYVHENKAYTYTLNIQNYLRNIVKDVERDRKYDVEYKHNINKLIEDHSLISKSKQANDNEKNEAAKASNNYYNRESISPQNIISRFGAEKLNNKSNLFRKEIDKEVFFLEEEKLSLKSNYKLNERDLSQPENSNTSIKMEASSDLASMLNEVYRSLR
jgi:hypothetical protein